MYLAQSTIKLGTLSRSNWNLEVLVQDELGHFALSSLLWFHTIQCDPPLEGGFLNFDYTLSPF